MTATLDRGHYNRPPVLPQDNGWVIRASAFGWCDRALWYASRGVDTQQPPEHMLKAAEQGQLREQEILAAGIELVGGERADDFLHATRIINAVITLSATVDGWCNIGKQHIPVECKLLANPHEPLELLRINPTYGYQALCEMFCNGVDRLLYVVAGSPDTSGGPFKKLHAEIVTFDQVTEIVGDLQQRASHVGKLLLSDQAPDCDRAMFPCGFYEFHDGQQVWAKPDLPVINDDEPTAKLTRFLEIKQLIKELEAESKEITEWFFSAGFDPNQPMLINGKKVTLRLQEIPEQTITRQAHTRRFIEVRK